jgi:hypothetical protein
VTGIWSIFDLLKELDFGLFTVALLLSSALSLLVTLIVWFNPGHRKDFWLLFLPTLALSGLGFMTGDVMGGSRMAAVGTVLPAVLTLLGGLVVYLVGVKGVHSQIAVSSMVLCFAFSFFIGAHLGARLRLDPDTADPVDLLSRALELEDNRKKLEIQRLLNYVELLELKRDLTDQKKLDLSRFESGLETKPPAGR